MCEKIISAIICLCVIFCCTGCAEAETEVQKDIQPGVFDSVIENDTLINNLQFVCESIKLDQDEIRNMEKIDDWAGGSRYSFVYHTTPFVIYCNTDSTIESVKIGTYADVFKRGYEPYNISNFILTEDEKLQLQICGEDTVKQYLNYPDTADFHTMDWGFGRDHDLYYVSGKVTAQNAFGTKEKMPFSVVCSNQNENLIPAYVEIAGAVPVDRLAQYPRPERVRVDMDEQQSTELQNTVSGMILEDGQLGEYGREDKIGEEVYIDFYVPEGTYEIKNLAKSCTVFIVDNNTNDPVQTIALNEQETKEQIQIGEEQHVELTMYAKIELVP